MPQRRRLTGDLFTVASIRSETGRAVLRDMIDLYQQDTEVAFRSGLEPEKCCCAVERRRQIDMFVHSSTFHEEQALTLYLNQEISPAEMESHIQLLQKETQGEPWTRRAVFCLQ